MGNRYYDIDSKAGFLTCPFTSASIQVNQKAFLKRKAFLLHNLLDLFAGQT